MYCVCVLRRDIHEKSIPNIDIWCGFSCLRCFTMIMCRLWYFQVFSPLLDLCTGFFVSWCVEFSRYLLDYWRMNIPMRARSKLNPNPFTPAINFSMFHTCSPGQHRCEAIRSQTQETAWPLQDQVENEEKGPTWLTGEGAEDSEERSEMEADSVVVHCETGFGRWLHCSCGMHRIRVEGYLQQLFRPAHTPTQNPSTLKACTRNTGINMANLKRKCPIPSLLNSMFIPPSSCDAWDC